jgi:hypothetical protein
MGLRLDRGAICNKGRYTVQDPFAVRLEALLEEQGRGFQKQGCFSGERLTFTGVWV